MKTKTANKLIGTGGIFSALFLILHIAFYWILNWGKTLEVMNPEDKAILLTLNLVVILLLIYAVAVSFCFTRQLPQTATGRSLLLFFASFYSLRMVAEFIYFGFRFPSSFVAITLCLIPALCYVIPAIGKSE